MMLQRDGVLEAANQTPELLSDFKQTLNCMDAAEAWDRAGE